MSFVPQPTEVLLQNVRVSYCHLLEPWANSTQPGAKPRYSATILLPKTDVAQHQALMNAIEAAIQAARTKFGARVPAQPKVPIHDGDGYTQSGKEFGPECKGHWVFTAAQDASYKVEVVDLQGNPLTNPTQVYSGMYVNVLVRFFFYSNQSTGIGCGLGPVQKVRDGEALGSMPVAASSVFGAPQGSAANVYTGAPVAAGQPVQQQAPQQGYVQPAYATTPQQSGQQAPVGINPVTGQPY
ncbi:DUF2815 family protein [Veillonella parvula]|uniref:DUF2815 family protein n=1 Tax=Veillonella parvula TaxID=29466 RepID=UPI0028E43861|nr:DUF2815 family protein [Veillonella parvula]